METKQLNKLKPQTKGFLKLVGPKSVPAKELTEFQVLGREKIQEWGHYLDPFISERHCRIELKKNRYYLTDLRSSNGCFINGTQVSEAFLNCGDLIKIGSTLFRFQSQRETSKADTLLKSKNLKWQKQLDELTLCARSELPLLVTGPSGTGKEVIAELTHSESPRKRNPMVSVNCSALSPTLIESELFGHKEGSFTGATGDRKGAFEAARGGTLFLDEIGDLPLELQPKLLRALEAREIKPVGSDKTIETDVRIIAATHKNLYKLVQEGSFREDLFYRLAVLNLETLPLKERMEDFEDIIYSFCKEYSIGLTAGAIQLLTDYDWPGNIRELKNFIAKLSTLAGGESITRRQVKEHLVKRPRQPQIASMAGKTLAEIEKQIICSGLKKNYGNQSKTAKQLGMAKSTLHDRIKKYKIDIKGLLDF